MWRASLLIRFHSEQVVSPLFDLFFLKEHVSNMSSDPSVAFEHMFLAIHSAKDC